MRTKEFSEAVIDVLPCDGPAGLPRLTGPFNRDPAEHARSRHTKGAKAMASESSSTSGGGVGVCGLLLVAFLVLKLCGVIHWSWWWVLAPAWIPVLLVIAIGLIALVAWFIYSAVKS